MFEKIGDRFKSYERVYDQEIIKRIPIVIRIDGRGFSRLTKKLPRPYCPEMQQVMAATALYTITEMQGAVFGYAQSDECTFILKNDQSNESEPWFSNRIQKIVSISAGLATIGFNKCLKTLEIDLDLVGDALFDARVFALPSISECANNLIWRQLDCMKNAISGAAQAELGKKFGKKTAFNMLHGKISREKKEMLLHHCGIEFEEYYPSSFRHGIAIYKVPTVVNGTTRNKWTINNDLPNFIQDKDFLFNILINGADVFRIPNLEKNPPNEILDEEDFNDNDSNL